MQRSLVRLTACALFAAVFVAAGSASAQQSRTFVSGHGTDTGTCTVAAPCRSLAYALTQTGAGGEISVQDAAGYGPVVIGQALSIVNDGAGDAAVSPTSGSAIVVNAGATDIVNLRGLTLVGNGVGTDAIVWHSGASLNIQNCVVRGFTQYGLLYEPAGNSNLTILDTVIAENGIHGIELQPPPSGSQANFYFNGLRIIYNRYDGIILVSDSGQPGIVQGVIHNSTIAENQTYGLVIGSSAGSGNIDLVGDDISANGEDGILIDTSSLVPVLSGSTITNNAGYGIESIGDFTVYTLQNNNISGNKSGSTSNVALTAQAPH